MNKLKRPWGFFIYIAGDNSLSAFGLSDLEELCKIGCSSKTMAAVEIDTKGEFEGSIRYEITQPDFQGKAYRIVIDRIPEADTSSPQTLGAFLDWKTSRYQAEKEIFVMWGHGSGFKGRKRDVAFDDTGYSMDIPTFARVLNSKGYTGKQKLAIVGFDACLMSMLEVAFEMSDSAELMVGSQQTEPGEGWPYEKVLGALNTLANPVQVGRKIVEEYITFYRRRRMSDVTQSMLNLGLIEPLCQKVDTLGKALKLMVPDEKQTIRKLRNQMQEFEYADYVDLKYLCELLGQAYSGSAVQAMCKDIIKQIRISVLHSRAYGRAVKNANGLSIWFPGNSGDFLDFRSKYLALSFSSQFPNWLIFLEEFLT